MYRRKSWLWSKTCWAAFLSVVTDERRLQFGYVAREDLSDRCRTMEDFRHAIKEAEKLAERKGVYRGLANTLRSVHTACLEEPSFQVALEKLFSMVD